MGIMTLTQPHAIYVCLTTIQQEHAFAQQRAQSLALLLFAFFGAAVSSPLSILTLYSLYVGLIIE